MSSETLVRHDLAGRATVFPTRGLGPTSAYPLSMVTEKNKRAKTRGVLGEERKQTISRYAHDEGQSWRCYSLQS